MRRDTCLKKKRSRCSPPKLYQERHEKGRKGGDRLWPRRGKKGKKGGTCGSLACPAGKKRKKKERPSQGFHVIAMGSIRNLGNGVRYEDVREEKGKASCRAALSGKKGAGPAMPASNVWASYRQRERFLRTRLRLHPREEGKGGRRACPDPSI